MMAGMAASVAKPTPYKDTIPLRVRKLVDARDSVDGVRLSVLSGMAGRLHRHHRRLKQMGGDTRPHTDCPCNVILLDEGEHYWAHTIGRVDAEAEGLIVPSAVLFPGAASVLVHGEGDAGGAEMWPTCDGHWSDRAPGELVAA